MEFVPETQSSSSSAPQQHSPEYILRMKDIARTIQTYYRPYIKENIDAAGGPSINPDKVREGLCDVGFRSLRPDNSRQIIGATMDTIIAYIRLGRYQDALNMVAIAIREVPEYFAIMGAYITFLAVKLEPHIEIDAISYIERMEGPVRDHLIPIVGNHQTQGGVYLCSSEMFFHNVPRSISPDPSTASAPDPTSVPTPPTFNKDAPSPSPCNPIPLYVEAINCHLFIKCLKEVIDFYICASQALDKEHPRRVEMLFNYVMYETRQFEIPRYNPHFATFYTCIEFLRHIYDTYMSTPQENPAGIDKAIAIIRLRINSMNKLLAKEQENPCSTDDADDDDDNDFDEEYHESTVDPDYNFNVTAANYCFVPEQSYSALAYILCAYRRDYAGALAIYTECAEQIVRDYQHRQISGEENDPNYYLYDCYMNIAFLKLVIQHQPFNAMHAYYQAHTNPFTRGHFAPAYMIARSMLDTDDTLSTASPSPANAHPSTKYFREAKEAFVECDIYDRASDFADVLDMCKFIYLPVYPDIPWYKLDNGNHIHLTEHVSHGSNEPAHAGASASSSSSSSSSLVVYKLGGPQLPETPLTTDEIAYERLKAQTPKEDFMEMVLANIDHMHLNDSTPIIGHNVIRALYHILDRWNGYFHAKKITLEQRKKIHYILARYFQHLYKHFRNDAPMHPIREFDFNNSMLWWVHSELHEHPCNATHIFMHLAAHHMYHSGNLTGLKTFVEEHVFVPGR